MTKYLIRSTKTNRYYLERGYGTSNKKSQAHEYTAECIKGDSALSYCVEMGMVELIPVDSEV